LEIYRDASRQKSERNQLTANGVTTKGWLDNKYVERRKLIFEHYNVTYNFFDSNLNFHSATDTVDQRPFASEITVTYLPSDPSVSRLSNSSTGWLAPEIALVIMVVAGFIVVAILFHYLLSVATTIRQKQRTPWTKN